MPPRVRRICACLGRLSKASLTTLRTPALFAQPGAGDLEFEGSILQDVRAGQAGFATRLKVEQGGSSAGGTASELGAAEGDVVTLSYDTVVDGADGGPTTALAPPDEPLTFEVGASGVMGNPLFQAFDRAVRGLRVGDSAVVKALGGEYDKELLFAVPRDHEEVVRLEAEAAASGGLKEGAVVQLANGQAAVIRRVADDGVLIDCNHPLAGAPLSFTLRVLALERGAGRSGLAAAVE